MSISYNLLNYKRYEDYLGSFTKIEDHRYIGNVSFINHLMMLGYRTRASSVYTKDEFEANKKKAIERLNPTVRAKNELYCKDLQTTDPVLEALADREEANVVQGLSTIIFMQVRQRSGFDISGYIDYSASLHKCNLQMKGANDWKAIFEGRAKLRPKTSDLSYYDWHSNNVHCNDSDNYNTVAHPIHGLYFLHKGDHKKVYVTTRKNPCRENTRGITIYSKTYGYVVLYDHHVRKKV